MAHHVSPVRTQYLREKLGLPPAAPKSESGIGRMERLAKEDIAKNSAASAGAAAQTVEKSKVGKFFSKVGSVPKGAHTLIADTFKRSSSASEATSKLGKFATSTAFRTTSGYAAAAGSGGLSAWLTHKFLPESIQGTLRKVTVGGAGVGGAFLPSLAKKLITHFK